MSEPIEEHCRRRTVEARRDPRSTHEIIADALTETDEDRAWEHVGTLHYRATHDVLEAVAVLCKSECVEERALAANVLGQLGVPKRAFPEECHRLLADMLAGESDADVIGCICVAFGHLGNPACVPLVLPLQYHPDAGVRLNAAYALMGEEDPRAISALVKLSADPDADVRDWATFSLGTQINLDTPEIREALALRLDDSDGETRAEAITGLVNRKDPRALPAQFSALEDGPERFDPRCDLILAAAATVGDRQLLPGLRRWREAGCDEVHALDEAIGACGGTAGMDKKAPSTV
jgi:HEAT repeat protein